MKLGFSNEGYPVANIVEWNIELFTFRLFPGNPVAYWIIQAFLGARFSVLETSMSLWKFGVLAKNLSEAIFNGYQLTGNG